MGISTIYMPSFLRPYNECVDMVNNDTQFSAIVNGLQIDSYRLQIKKLDNTMTVYDSNSTSIVTNTDPSIAYNGTWYDASMDRVIDDFYSGIQYSGSWLTGTTKTGNYDGTYHASKSVGSIAQLNFTGTGIKLYTFNNAANGICQIYIDGVDKGTFDTYSASPTYQNNIYTITGLENKDHTIEVKVTGTKNASAIDYWIEIDHFVVINGNSVSNTSSNITDSYIQYSNFNGTGIEAYFQSSPEAGIADIFIDGVKQSSIDLYSINNASNFLGYSNSNLTNGNHTIQIKVTSNKNGNSRNNYVYFEKFQVLSKTILSQPVYDQQTLSITIPANTVTYRGALKWQLTYWNSSNDGENVSSSEMIFTNMSVPTLTNNVPNVVNGKSFTFEDEYSQNENIQIKKWNKSIYAVNYDVSCGYFGQNVTPGGTQIDCGEFGDTTSTKRYSIDCGTW